METARKEELEQGLDPSPWRWLETAVITIGPVLVAVGLRPTDPLFVTSNFPWLSLAPLLVGLRYGFAHGFASALVLAVAMGVSHRMGWGPQGLALPGSRIVGTLVVGMLAGEFADRWLRRIQRLRVIGRYRQQRLEEFSRAYHLLKVSHDRLEERMAGNTTSLRGALLTLRRRLADGRAGDLGAVGEAVMDLFAEHGWVQVAGLHAVEEGGQVVAEPAARLGAAGPIDPGLRMVRRGIESRSLVTVRELPESEGPLAVVPLEDVDGRLFALVVIHEMPFVAFTEEHLHLLVVLGGHTADLLSAAETTTEVLDPARQDFLRSLRRAHVDLRQFDLPASLVALTIGPPAVRVGVDRMIEGTKRGLDHDWRRMDAEGRVVFMLLMPLTDAQGVEGYEKRVRALIRDRFAGAFGEEEVTLIARPLTKQETPEAQLAELGRQCGLES